MAAAPLVAACCCSSCWGEGGGGAVAAGAWAEGLAAALPLPVAALLVAFAEERMTMWKLCGPPMDSYCAHR